MIVYLRKRRSRLATLLEGSLSDIIRTRLSVRLIGSSLLLIIDGRQPICFLKASLSQSSIPLRSKISKEQGRSKARHRFADGLSPFKKR